MAPAPDILCIGSVLWDVIGRAPVAMGRGSDVAGRIASEGHAGDVIWAQPPPVMVTRVTGAGDTFMAAHIAAEAQGAGRRDALERALEAAANHISGVTTE